MSSTANDLCAVLAALHMGSQTASLCCPPWHGRQQDHWKRSDHEAHKFYLVLGGSDIASLQLGIYTDWVTVKHIVKDRSGAWRAGMVLYANHGRPWTYAAAVEYWQQDCGQGRPGHSCTNAAAMPPRYATPPPPSVPQSPSAPTANPAHNNARFSSPHAARTTGGSDLAVMRFMVIDGDSEVYTDEQRVEDEVERRFAMGQRPHVLRFATLTDALRGTSSPTRRRY